MRILTIILLFASLSAGAQNFDLLPTIDTVLSTDKLLIRPLNTTSPALRRITMQQLKRFVNRGVIDTSIWRTGNGNLYQSNTSLNVGIGTTTPFGKFTVNDNAKNLVFGAQYSDLVSDTVWGTTMIDSCHKYGMIIQDPSSPNDHYTVLYSMDSCTGEGAQLFLNHDAYNQEMGIILNYDNPDTNKAARLTFNSDGLRVLKNTDFSYLFQITPTGQMVYPKGAASGKILTSDASGNATWGNQILTGSATLDFGTIAPNSHETLTITVTGAALGDVVSLGIPNASTNDHGAFMAWVSATNTVSVKCFNFDGVGFNPASGVFKVKIFK